MHMDFISALTNGTNLDTTRENLSKRLRASFDFQRDCIERDYQDARFLQLGLVMPPDTTGRKVAEAILASYKAEPQGGDGWYGLPKQEGEDHV